MKHFTLLVFILTFSTQSIYSQYTASPILSMGDKIELKKGSDGDFYYFHQIKHGQTLYALSKTFGQSLQSLIASNNKSDSTVGLDETIKIEIPQNYLYKGVKPTKNENTIYIPVIYKTQSKDNLYKISKLYFNQSIEEIQKRNNMQSTNLAIHSEVLLGWYPLSKNIGKKPWTAKPTKSRAQILKEINELKKSIKGKTTVTTKSTVVVTQNENSTEIVDTFDNFNEFLLDSIPNLDDKNLIVEKDVANWDKNIADNGELYVLHNSAVLDSYVEIENEFVNRTVRAKVIGKIPFGSYTSDVQLIISPAAAKALGALDERVRVKISYYN